MLRHAQAGLCPGLVQLLEGAACRTSAAVTQIASYASLSHGSALSLDEGTGKPVLLRLQQRTWGPPATLTDAQAAAAKQAASIGVLRDAFACFDQAYRPLDQVVKGLGGSTVAISTSVATPETRVVVDEYVRSPSGTYTLKRPATDLLRYLHHNGVRVALLPDVSSVSPAATAVRGVTRGVRQSSNEVLMVAPTAFGFNEQAAQDNSFMHTASKAGEGESTLTRQVLREFAGLHRQLTEVAGVKVTLFEHSLDHGTPDACFPNNWFSTHPAGEADGGVSAPTLVLYPMKHPNRSAERREDILGVLRARGYGRELDMAKHEAGRKYFEGTGVLVLDRVNGVAYVDISERADEGLAREWVDATGYKNLVTFRSTDLRGKSVYHTNVMMAIGTGVAIVCAESVADPKERQHLIASLAKTHEVVQISLKQMDALCGNALEVESGHGVPVMAMSTQAYNAFTEDQRRAIRRHVADIVHSPIDTLENVGGGGVRCTLAELF